MFTMCTSVFSALEVCYENVLYINSLLTLTLTRPNPIHPNFAQHRTHNCRQVASHYFFVWGGWREFKLVCICYVLFLGTKQIWGAAPTSPVATRLHNCPKSKNCHNSSNINHFCKIVSLAHVAVYKTFIKRSKYATRDQILLFVCQLSEI